MRVVTKITLLLTALLSLSSCISLFDIRGVEPSLMPAAQEIRNNKIDDQKYGEACTINVLWLIAIGDSSIETAATNANIKKISAVHTKYNHFFFYLPFYQEGCTIVTGE